MQHRPCSTASRTAQVRMMMSWQIGQWTKCSPSTLGHHFHFHCGLVPTVPSWLALDIHIPPSSEHRVVGMGRKPLSPTASTLGVTWQLPWGGSTAPWQGDKRFSAFAEQETPKRDWTIIQVTFSSLLHPWGAYSSCFLIMKQGASAPHQEAGRRRPPYTAKPRNRCCSGWISVLILNYKAQEQLSARNFWFCFLFLSSCS